MAKAPIPKKSKSGNNKKKRISKNKKVGKNATFTVFRWWWYSSLKLLLAFLLALFLYTIYLDGKVRRTFEGQRWQVPVQVYGKIDTLNIGAPLVLNELVQLLQFNAYKKVKEVTRVAQLSLAPTELIFYRRAFDFGDIKVNKAQKKDAKGINPAIKITVRAEYNHITELLIGQQNVSSARVFVRLYYVPDGCEA